MHWLIQKLKPNSSDKALTKAVTVHGQWWATLAPKQSRVEAEQLFNHAK